MKSFVGEQHEDADRGGGPGGRLAPAGPAEDLELPRGEPVHGRGGGEAVNALLIHELAHDRVMDHLSDGFHKECCRLGAKLVQFVTALLVL